MFYAILGPVLILAGTVGLIGLMVLPHPKTGKSRLLRVSRINSSD